MCIWITSASVPETPCSFASPPLKPRERSAPVSKASLPSVFAGIHPRPPAPANSPFRRICQPAPTPSPSPPRTSRTTLAARRCALKWFRNRLRRPVLIGAFVAAVVVASTMLALRVTRLRPLGAALFSSSSLHEWLENTEAGSSIESALYRLMTLPTGDVLYRRSPRETRPQLTELIKTNGQQAALYSLRALQDEQALDFVAAEADWKAWTDHAPDRAAAELDLAGFYDRRLRPQDEIAALTVVAQSPAPPAEKFVASGEQRSWKAFERMLT